MTGAVAVRDNGGVGGGSGPDHGGDADAGRAVAGQWDRRNYGAGAGGGIYVAVGTLQGAAGRIAAGGSSTQGYGGGGGGRVAVYAQDFTGFNVAGSRRWGERRSR